MKIFKILIAVVILLAGLATLNACQEKSPLEDCNWVLTSYGQPESLKEPLEGTEIFVIFQSEDKTVSGSGSCNHYSGTYEIDGLNLIVGESMAVTEMWCGEDIGEQEHQYLTALVAAESFSLDKDNLIIYCGNVVLNFTMKE